MSTETIMFIRDSEARMATSTFTQLLNSNVSFQCCFTSTETIRLIRDREGTPDVHLEYVLLYVHRSEMAY